MSEKGKSIIIKLSKEVPKLDKEKQNYVLGIVEGMAIMREEESDSGIKSGEPAEEAVQCVS